MVIELDTASEVDEMASFYDMGSRDTVCLLPIEKIRFEPQDNLREDYGNVEELNSIIEYGIIQPILGEMKRDPETGEDYFQAADGFRRLTEYKILKEQGHELKLIPCKQVKGCTEEANKILLTFATATQKPLTLVEKGKGFIYLRDHERYTLEQLAEKGRCSKQAVIDAIAFVENVPEPLKTLVEKGTVSATKALETVREQGEIKAQDTLMKAAEIAVTEGKSKVNSSHLRQVRQEQDKQRFQGDHQTKPTKATEDDSQYDQYDRGYEENQGRSEDKSEGKSEGNKESRTADDKAESDDLDKRIELANILANVKVSEWVDALSLKEMRRLAKKLGM